MSEELKKTDIKKIAGRGCLIVAGILFLIFLCRYNQIKKESLYDTEGRTFAKATVMNVLQDNETKDGIYIGRQLVKLKITSGKWKGKIMEADSSSAYLYGAHCKKDSKVIALVSEANGSFSASVYSVDRDASLSDYRGFSVNLNYYRRKTGTCISDWAGIYRDMHFVLIFTDDL